ncbi:MAG TPA: winged helix DNA-binding domain-containing protein, partial [Ktedonobacterales bacterium]|nr:winged helix DNA-binding domain-containing protein [Ktedonobacterales bacterium]
MIRSLTSDEVRQLRLRSQCLTGTRPTNVYALLRSIGSLQAQETSAARLAVRPRSTGLNAAAVTRACNEERSVVRTWAMRGTLHMLPAEDVGWLVALLGPGFVTGDRRRRLQLGLDDDLCARALPAIHATLSRTGPLTRTELVSALAAAGVRIDAKGQAPAHLVFYAAMHGLICRGPDREDDEPTYVLLAEWVGTRHALDPDTALAELARRYFTAYSPASARDFASWAGIALGKATRGIQLIASELEAVEVAGAPAWLLAATSQQSADLLGLQDASRGIRASQSARLPPQRSLLSSKGGTQADFVAERPPGANSFAGLATGNPCVRLLPRFDAYLLGYNSRDLVLPAR